MEHSIQLECDIIPELTNNNQYNSSTQYYTDMIRSILPDNIESASSRDGSKQRAITGIRFIKKSEDMNDKAASSQEITNTAEIRESLKSVDVEFYRTIEESPFTAMKDSPLIMPQNTTEIARPNAAPQVVSYADLIGKLYNDPPPPTSQSTPDTEKLKPAQYVTDIVLRVSEQDRILVNDCYRAYRHIARSNSSSTNSPAINLILEAIANLSHIIKISKMLRGDPRRAKLLYDTFSLFKVKQRRVSTQQWSHMYTHTQSQSHTQSQCNVDETYNYDSGICEEMYELMFRYQLRREREMYVYNFNQFVQALECADVQYMDIIYSTKVNCGNVIGAFEELKWSLKCCLYYLVQFISYFEDSIKNTQKGYTHVIEIFSRISVYTYSFLDYMSARDRAIVDACSTDRVYVLRTIKYQGWNLYNIKNRAASLSSSESRIRPLQTPTSISDILWPDRH